MRGGAITESLIKFIFNQAHPVGSYYWSSDSTNPANLFGGTWEQIKDTFILAAGDTYKAGTTGGEATHTLTTDEMPSHNHESPILGVVGGSNLKGDDPWANQVDSGRQAKDYYTKNTGGGQPHNNMPPYKVAYCWHRTA